MASTRKRVPARTISASKFKATCLELMDEVATRQIEVIVTKRGKPIVKLAPVQVEPPNPIGFLRGTVLWYGDIVSPDFEAWAESPSDPLK